MFSRSYPLKVRRSGCCMVLLYYIYTQVNNTPLSRNQSTSIPIIDASCVHRFGGSFGAVDFSLVRLDSSHLRSSHLQSQKHAGMYVRTSWDMPAWFVVVESSGCRSTVSMATARQMFLLCLDVCAWYARCDIYIYICPMCNGRN